MDKMKRNSLRANGLLMLAALIWGTAFVAQSVGMDYVGPFTFNAARFLIGGAVLIPVLLGRAGALENRRAGIFGGICCGAALFAGSSLQQIGIAQTTVGKAGFITALYMVLVPLLEMLFGKKPGRVVWISVAAATLGMYLLCVTEGFSIGTGDLYVLGCAVCFAVHILVIDHFSPKADGVFLSCVQFFTAGVLASACALTLETPRLPQLTAAWAPVLYAGVLSCGVAYTLQVVAQRHTDPVLASMILSLESVFSVLAGWALLGEVLSARELAGCLLVFAAIVLVQLPVPEKQG